MSSSLYNLRAISEKKGCSSRFRDSAKLLLSVSSRGCWLVYEFIHPLQVLSYRESFYLASCMVNIIFSLLRDGLGYTGTCPHARGPCALSSQGPPSSCAIIYIPRAWVPQIYFINPGGLGPPDPRLLILYSKVSFISKRTFPYLPLRDAPGAWGKFPMNLDGHCIFWYSFTPLLSLKKKEEEKKLFWSLKFNLNVRSVIWCSAATSSKCPKIFSLIL